MSQMSMGSGGQGKGLGCAERFELSEVMTMIFFFFSFVPFYNCVLTLSPLKKIFYKRGDLGSHCPLLLLYLLFCKD